MGKKNRKHKKNSLLQFNIANFEINNYYLFISTKFKTLLNGINDANSIKPSLEEIDFIQEKIEQCISYNDINKNLKVIEIKQNFYNIFKNMNKIDLCNSEYGKKISFILESLKSKRETITLKKIADYYSDLYETKISISTVSRILKKHLNIRYLKTSIKNPKLDEINYIRMSFIFIRGIIRSLILNLNFIFIDETGFLLENNYYSWRNSDEEINKCAKNKQKEKDEFDINCIK